MLLYERMTLTNVTNSDFDGYIPPSWDVRFMKQVYLAAESSKDPSSKIGAVLVKDRNVISTGYNGFARGVLDLPERYNDRQLKYKFVVHAEDNAILTAARLGIPTMGTTLYTQAIPCNECMKAVIQGGIKEIVIHSKWPMTHSQWSEAAKISEIMRQEAGIIVRTLDIPVEMIGYLDGKKYSV